jgi:hypothetical protein
MRKAVLLFAVIGAAVPAAAQEDNDLSRIPGAVQSAPAPTQEGPTHGKYFLEDAFGWQWYRGTLSVPITFGEMPSRWSNRTSLDALDSWTLAPTLTATFSDRLAATFSDGVGFPNEVVRNDPREAYLTWEALPETYLEAGRINVRNGVAFGFNPTDFFRSRTTVAQASVDPGAQRQNRLGVAMVRAERIFEGGTLDFMYAPKMHTPAPIGVIAGPFDPKFDQTNAADRLLASYSFEMEEFSPQVLVYHESGRTKFGVNLSHPIGASVIAYLTWAGGVAPDTIVDAIAFGKRTGTIPSFVPVVPPTNSTRQFQNDVSLGAYWTGEDKETISLEYNYHQAGLSKADWRNWFSIGANPLYAPVMWYIRGYANDQQVPISQHQVFVRADWVEPWNIEHFDINGFVMTSLEDGSCLGQFTAYYDITDNWSIAGYFGGTIGGGRSEWGSLRGAANATVQVVHYL